jgi:hypothetical protein
MRKLKKLKLFIHPCYGKCGTTFLQENIFSKLKNLKYLGKPFKNRKIKDLHKKVFIPNYIELNNNSINFDNKNLDIYVKEITKEIITSKKKNVILSDENIFDFFDYDVNKNFVILSKIIKILKKKFDLEVCFIISIRSQHELLLSLYSYGYTRKKRIFGKYENFLETVLKKENEYSLAFEFDKMIKLINKLYKPKKIHLFILENLSIKPEDELKKLLKFLGEKSRKDLSPNSKNKSYISNSNTHGKTYALKDYSLNFYLFKLYSFLNLRKVLSNNIKTKIKKRLNFLRKISLSSPSVIRNSLIQRKKIKKFFKNSNKKIEKDYRRNLRELNYY